MVRKKETDNFLANKKRNSSSEKSGKCYSIWWRQGFQHQRKICRIIESNYFRALVIFLVILDAALVITEIMLDSYKIHDECKSDTDQTSKKEDEKIKHRTELAMEIAHFSSIAILVFFVLELIIRIYANGKEFWNIRKKKMEYFDAFIVITSLIIDLYLLHVGKEVLRKHLLFIFSFRLWRFVRIIGSVSEGIRHGQQKHKEHLENQYLIAIHRLIDISKHKTNYFQNNNENFNLLLEHYQMIDNQCQSSIDELDQNDELTSTELITQFIQEIDGLENKHHDSIISAMFTPSKVDNSV